MRDDSCNSFASKRGYLGNEHKQAGFAKRFVVILSLPRYLYH